LDEVEIGQFVDDVTYDTVSEDSTDFLFVAFDFPICLLVLLGLIGLL
jgi:hypothetical protein